MDDVNTGTWHRWLGLRLPATVRFLDEPPSCLLQTNALLITLWNSSLGADPGGKEPLWTTPAVQHWGGIPGAGTVLPLPSLLLTPPGAARRGAVLRDKRAQPRKHLGKARISPQICKNSAHRKVKISAELSVPSVQGQGLGLAVQLCPSPALSPFTSGCWKPVHKPQNSPHWEQPRESPGPAFCGKGIQMGSFSPL